MRKTKHINSYEELNKIAVLIDFDKIFSSVFNTLNIPAELIHSKTRKMDVIDAKKIATIICIDLINQRLQWHRRVGLSKVGFYIKRNHSTVRNLYVNGYDLINNCKKFRLKYEQCLPIKQSMTI